ncbi:4-carboxymuconolactone decarboxylase [Burkholderia multivorans]
MRERAFVLPAQLNPQAPNKVTAGLDRLSDDFAEVVSGFVFADVVSRPGITLHVRKIPSVRDRAQTPH